MADEEVRILCVDDEPSILKSLRRLFLDDDYEILVATSVDEGIEIMRSVNPVHVVLSDYRMPGMNGVNFLREVRQHWPDTVRIVLSGYADAASIVSAINEGEIYKFVPKPWNDDELRVTLTNAVERYFLCKKNMELTEELRGKNEDLRRMNEELEQLVSERTAELMFQNQVLIVSRNILDCLPVAVVGIDCDGLIVECNKKGVELFAHNTGNLVGMNRRDTLCEEMNTFVDNVVENGVLDGQLRINSHRVSVKGVFMKYPQGQQGVVLVFDA